MAKFDIAEFQSALHKQMEEISEIRRAANTTSYHNGKFSLMKFDVQEVGNLTRINVSTCTVEAPSEQIELRLDMGQVEAFTSEDAAERIARVLGPIERRNAIRGLFAKIADRATSTASGPQAAKLLDQALDNLLTSDTFVVVCGRGASVLKECRALEQAKPITLSLSRQYADPAHRDWAIHGPCKNFLVGLTPLDVSERQRLLYIFERIAVEVDDPDLFSLILIEPAKRRKDA